MILTVARTSFLAVACSFVLGALELHAQQARLTISSERPRPGALVTVTVSSVGDAADSLVAVHGTMGGEPLHFHAARGAYRAVGAVPVDSVGMATAEAIVARASGRVDTLRTSVAESPLPPPAERLDVAERFGRQLDSATAARVAREAARVAALGRRSHGVAARWGAPFARPRASAISSGFGSGRTFNGQVTSRHLGVDFRGALGAPVRAANRGVVVLVDTFFLGGRVVYIDHGEGLTTGYLHLSKALVAPGQTVARGQVIGRVGATGRVTGPHLHWSAHYGALVVNPLDLLALRAQAP